MSKNIWWERHRPQSLDEMIGQDAIVEEFESILSGQSPLQNYIFSSYAPGTGKTTLAYIISKTLGYQLHIFNASSKKTRGIEFIEEYIIPLARSGLNEVIILLDEADRLTPQAQDALKGVIEEATCYFILTCNKLKDVSVWLQSRCQVKHFQPLLEIEVIERLRTISIRESMKIEEHELECIANYHRGDLRNSIGALQSISTMSDSKRQEFILSLTASGLDCGKFLKLCFKNRNIDEAFKILDSQKTDSRYIIRTIFEFAMKNSASVENKIRVIEASVQAERDLLNGVDEYIALHEFCRALSVQ